MYIGSGLLLLCPDLVGITFCTPGCQICPGAEAIVRGCYLTFFSFTSRKGENDR